MPRGDVVGILDSTGTVVVKYKYDAFGNCTRYDTANSEVADANPIRYRSYYYDVETGLYYLEARYYNPAWRRFISPDASQYLDPDSVNGLNLYAYANNNPVTFSYRQSSAIESFNNDATNYSSLTNKYFSPQSAKRKIRVELDMEQIKEGIDWCVKFKNLAVSGYALANHTSYFFKNLPMFSDDMEMLGVSIKEGILAFNKFSWSLGKADAFSIGLDIGLDVYDSIQRGVSIEGILNGAALTLVKDIGLIYLNKAILYGTTSLGTAIMPGVGTAIGYGLGVVICLFVDYFGGKWLDELIDEITQ